MRYESSENIQKFAKFSQIVLQLLLKIENLGLPVPMGSWGVHLFVCSSALQTAPNEGKVSNFHGSNLKFYHPSLKSYILRFSIIEK